MTLKLTGSLELATCSTCQGKGRVPCPKTLSVRSFNLRGAFPQPSDGKPIPCPTCKGRKVVAS